jgi:DNA-binding NarL/FixJ family response regulator
VIRVCILAETEDEAQQLAALLADDESIELTSAAGAAGSAALATAGVEPDVALVAGRALIGDLPFEQIPLVLLNDDLLDDDRAHADAWWDPAASIYACLPAHANPREISAALIAASQGLTLLTPAQAELIFQTRAPRTRTHPRMHPHNPAEVPVLYETLTPRELQVLRMLAEGLGNKEIAGQLGISDHTAKFHVASILGKLHAQTRTEAVTIGIRCGLVPI